MRRYRVCVGFLLVVLLYQPARSDFKKRKHPYLCASEAEKSEAANLDIRRFFSGYEGIYLALKNKTIFLELPVVNTFLDKTLLVFKDPIQFVIPDEVEQDQNIIGYVHDHYIELGSMKFYQIHLDAANPNKMGEVKEVLMNQLNKTDGDLGKVDLSAKYPHLARLKQQSVDKDQFLVFKITKTEQFMLKYSPKDGGTQETYEFCKLINSEPSCLPQITSHTEKSIKFFTYKLWDPEGDENSVLDLVQIDTDNRIYFSRRMLSFSGNEVKILAESTVPGGLRFDELLSCHAKFDKERQVKGVFFDAVLVDFYLFIKRFFIRAEEDLVQTGFRLEDEAYTRAQDIKTQIYGNKFELVKSRWVKTMRPGAYLVTSQRYVFDLTAKAFGTNNFKTQESENLIEKCPHNTLTIDGKVFCLAEKQYWFFVSEVNLHDGSGSMYAPPTKRWKISDIFRNSPGIGYGASEELKLTFNYVNDSFVFMTEEWLYVFGYDRFRVNDNREIVANYSAGERVLVVKNHFFDHLPKERSSLNHYVKVVILVLIIILILLIIWDVCISGQLTCGQLLQKCCMQKTDSPPGETAGAADEAKLRGSFDSPKTTKEMNSLVSGAPLKQSTSFESSKSGKSMRSGQSAPSGRSAQLGQSERSGQSEQLGKSEQNSQPARQATSIRFVDPKPFSVPKSKS